MYKFIIFISLSFLALSGLFLYQYLRSIDRTLHVAFCDVPKSDAILIRTPDYKNILIDAGPDKSILTCLNNHLPFWDKRLDLVLLTNRDPDYFTGIYYVYNRYHIISFVIDKTTNSHQDFKELLKTIAQQKISSRAVSAGERINLGAGLSLDILSNNLILKLTYNRFNLLLTGKAQVSQLEEVAHSLRTKIDILQVPSQGSSKSLNQTILDLLTPKLAIISVDLNNTSGYPKDKILSILSKSAIKVLRTDRDGDIEILSNGKSWWVR